MLADGLGQVPPPSAAVMSERLRCLTSIKAMEAGEYYVCKDFYMGKGTIFVSKGWMPLNLVKHALTERYIEGKDVTYAIIADMCLPANFFKDLVERLIKEYPSESKSLVNYLVGCFGALYHRTTTGGVTADFETAAATLVQTPGAMLHQVSTTQKDEETEEEAAKTIYFIQKTSEFMKSGGDVPIHRHVIAGSLISLDRMVKALDPAIIVGYNTDSVKIKHTGDGTKWCNEEVVKAKEDCQAGDYHWENDKKVVQVAAWTRWTTSQSTSTPSQWWNTSMRRAWTWNGSSQRAVLFWVAEVVARASCSGRCGRRSWVRSARRFPTP